MIRAATKTISGLRKRMTKMVYVKVACAVGVARRVLSIKAWKFSPQSHSTRAVIRHMCLNTVPTG